MCDVVRRLLAKFFRFLSRREQDASPAGQEHKVTAVEYEAVTLIAYEGGNARARAREQAEYCRQRGSEAGAQFWSEVAEEVRLRTRGRLPEKP